MNRQSNGCGKSRRIAARQHGLSRLNFEDDASSSPAGRPLTQSSFDVDDLVGANLRLGRIRQARYELLIGLLECPSPKLAKRLAGLERYERPVQASQRRFLRRWLRPG